MRDEDLDTMSADEFKRKYEDSWVEIKAQAALKGEGFNVRHNNTKFPENRNISSKPWVKIPGKSEIEKKCAEERVQKTKNYIFDAVDVRHKEILDPNEMSIAKLMDLAVKLMPQKVEGEVEHKFTYGDMILRASQNIEAVERVEKNELEDQSEEAELVEKS